METLTGGGNPPPNPILCLWDRGLPSAGPHPKSQANANHTSPIHFWDGLDLSLKKRNKEIVLCVAQDPRRNPAMS